MKNKEKDTLYCGVKQKRIEKAVPEFDSKALDAFLGFISERYKVHIRKDVDMLKPPYTDNPILKEYKFTNIRREHDRETKWLIKHITSNPDVNYSNKLLNCILFRLFNKHETSELIHQPIGFKKFHQNPNIYKKVLENAKSSGKILYTGAFFTTGMRQGVQATLAEAGLPAEFSGNDLLLFVDYLNQDGIVNKIKSASNPKEVFNILCSYKGLGSFLAYQVFVDFTYIENFPFSENEFTVAGPGCKKGLNYLFTNKCKMSDEECLFWLRDNWKKLKEINESNGYNSWFNPKDLMTDLPKYDRVMNVMSLENCFCEFSKYWRALTNTGRPRTKYNAEKRYKEAQHE